jgi:hypothetical protein
VDELGDPLIWVLACHNREKTRFFFLSKQRRTIKESGVEEKIQKGFDLAHINAEGDSFIRRPCFHMIWAIQ